MNLALAIAAGFLSGSIPVGYLVAKAKGVNIRAHGSGNIGATNVGRVLGAKWGLLCFALDAVKGLAPTVAYGVISGLAGRFDLSPAESWRWLAVMTAPVLGHVFCPWLGFKGGKGVSTALGSFLGVFPIMTIPGAGAVAVWICCLWFSRYVSLSSIAAAWSLPVWLLLEFLLRPVGAEAPLPAMDRAAPYAIVATVLAVLVTYLHRANLKRIKGGTEPRVKWLGRGRGSLAPTQPGSPTTSA